MRRWIPLSLIAVVLVLCAGAPCFAWAVDAEAQEGITLSADDAAAELEGCDFALDAFSRAQVGSNRPVDGEYYGYTYKVAGAPGRVSLIAVGDEAVVYLPRGEADRLGIDLENARDRSELQAMLRALDDATASGSIPLSQSATWHFTSEEALQVGGLVFSFEQELVPGSYYDCVIGRDGSDITDSENPLYAKPYHACFATVVPAGDAAIVAEPSTAESFASFMKNLDWSPLWVTLKTTLTAIVFIFILGLAAAYLCLRVSPRTRDILDTIFTIPMVLPPTVCGFLLLLALGSRTPIGQFFNSIGFPLIFSWPSTVIAAVVVAFPLMYRNARGAFEGLDPNMLDAARTLGWAESRVFFKIMLPLSWSSIAAGTVLAFARALGEFGATLFLAGNYLGITRTIPIAIYFEWMNGNTDIAIFWTIVIILFSFVVILFINLWSQHTTRYRRGAVEE